jgi:hypothetical protein
MKRQQNHYQELSSNNVLQNLNKDDVKRMMNVPRNVCLSQYPYLFLNRITTIQRKLIKQTKTTTSAAVQMYQILYCRT